MIIKAKIVNPHKNAERAFIEKIKEIEKRYGDIKLDFDILRANNKKNVVEVFFHISLRFRPVTIEEAIKLLDEGELVFVHPEGTGEFIRVRGLRFLKGQSSRPELITDDGRIFSLENLQLFQGVPLSESEIENMLRKSGLKFILLYDV